VTDLTIHPTAKFLKAGTVAAGLVFVALEILYLVEWRDQAPTWVMIFPPLILLWPLHGWIKRSMRKATISAERLRYEVGLFSKSTRTIQLCKVQDVRVDQGLFQRMFGVGNLSIETAGEASRLTLLSVDNPHPLADEILNRSHASASPHPPAGV
jgi:uncharacterized membrane protein YdbT with pleckstrin-like domain